MKAPILFFIFTFRCIHCLEVQNHNKNSQPRSDQWLRFAFSFIHTTPVSSLMNSMQQILCRKWFFLGFPNWFVKNLNYPLCNDDCSLVESDKIWIISAFQMEDRYLELNIDGFVKQPIFKQAKMIWCVKKSSLKTLKYTLLPVLH